MMKTKNLARALAIGMLLAVVMSAFPLSGLGRAATNSNPFQTIWLYGKQAIAADALINQQSPNTNYGSFQQLYMSQGWTFCGNATSTCNSLIKPDISAIPAGATIVDAELYYYMVAYTGSATNFYTLFNVTSSWSESTVTWNNKPSTQSWTCTGPPGVIVICDSGTVSTYEQGTYVSIPITGQVQAWYSGATTNNGIQISIASLNGNGASFISREATLGGANGPKFMITYQLPAATIYPAYYCTGGPCETGILSGSGLPPTLFNVTYAENNGTFRRAPRPDLLLTNVSAYYTLRVADFFGNFLYNASKVVTSTTFVWIVAIPYGIFQVYSMRDTFTSLSIKPAGGTAMVIDIPPRAWWALPLKSQVAYWLNFTLLDTNLNAIATINVIRTMGTKLSFIVNGTTLSQVVQNVNGNWGITNETFGVSAGLGNILLAPHGLNVFEAYYTVSFGIASLPITLWLFGVIAAILGWSAWAFAYRGELSRRIRSWPRRAKLFAGFALLPLSSTLIIAFIVHLAGGSVFIPIPWAPITH